jgi:predicted nucleotidyltransferase
LITEVRDKLDEIKKLCIRFHVRRLELFGSAVSGGTFDLNKSDLDFLVEFLTLQPGQYADSYFGLLESLEDLFSCSIDLVMPKAIKNPYFLESINKNREVLYSV